MSVSGFRRAGGAAKTEDDLRRSVTQVSLPLSRRGVLFGGLASSAGLAGCLGDKDLKYQLTVTVLIDGRRAVGAAVRRLRFHAGQVTNLDADRVETFGEAVVIDLGGRGPLFATLAAREYTQEGDRWYVSSSLWTPETAFKRAFGADHQEWARHLGQPIIILPTEYPVFAIFDDLSDPTSAREVDPAKLSVEFGPGASLVSVMAKIIQAPVTYGEVKRRLPWVTKMGPSSLTGKMAKDGSGSLSDNISPTQFVRR